ncbi:MAG: hypothetical protein DIU78_021385, partial [Pseudomonadota bacterium]
MAFSDKLRRLRDLPPPGRAPAPPAPVAPPTVAVPGVAASETEGAGEADAHVAARDVAVSREAGEAMFE